MGSGSSNNAESIGAPARDTGKMAQKNNVGEDKRVGNGHAVHDSIWSPRSGAEQDTATVDRDKMEKSRVDLEEVDKLQADLDKELLQGRDTLINRKRTKGSDVTGDVTSDDFNQEAEEEKILNEYNHHPNRNGLEESYPETYAEKMRRKNYTANEIKLDPVPERVLARQSVDWKVEQNIEGFDPNKFKAVNQTKNEEFFEPPKSPSVDSHENGANGEEGNGRENNIKYDITEEELMKNIESEFADL